VRNRAGVFVLPSPAGAEAAAAARPAAGGRAPTTGCASPLVDAAGPASYPLASITWLLLDRLPRDPARVRAVATFARWALRHGAADARALGYAPLPAALAARADADLAALGGAPAAPRGFARAPAAAAP
jgi:phosphate transport system substrate-binding protein